ncbi:MAG: GNAT family N-acetyltransferase [Rhodospirillales bacterium]
MTDWVIEPLAKRHDRKLFHCRIANLNGYIRERASQDVRNRVARVYAVTAPDSDTVAGYCSLSAAGFEPGALPEEAAGKLPKYNQLPAVLLGRLAVDQKFQGRGLGTYLLFDAFQTVLQAGAAIGACAVIVDAWDETAAEFYRQRAFRAFADDNLRFFMLVKDIQKTAEGAA